ncbi:MAG: hypothetical protein VR68_13780 [Peptococcaceae bacterium BRH_c4a]|nr:MAG: hypothetical protein VR68_13780 [Peptococcaceae bacterium BRH_c4a]
MLGILFLGKTLRIVSSETKFCRKADTKTPIRINGSASVIMLKKTVLKFKKLFQVIFISIFYLPYGIINLEDN